MKRSLRSTTWLAAVAALALFSFTTARAQGQRPAAATSKAVAPVDLTGYWVSVISQDWRWRMVTPAKGDYAGVPITAAAKKVADAWDPANDEAAGASCKAYGAPAIMRTPTRLRVSWQDENTLKIETDNGTQTRLLHFGAWKPGAAPRSLQGDSIAEWHAPRSARGQNNGPRYGSLQVTTKNLLPGYLRKNGVPYSENAVLTEYWDLYTEKNGDQWVVITAAVDDPLYLQVPWLGALEFRRERDGSKWSPEPCSAR
jgi:hypothetical protein